MTVFRPIDRSTGARRRARASLLAAGAVLGLVAIDAAGAQVDTTGTVRGVILSAATGEPVPRAAVSIVGWERATRADDAGRFRLAGLRAGMAVVRVRTLGYRQAEQQVTVPRGGEVELTVRLEPSPVRLGAVRTEAQADERARFERVAEVSTVSISSNTMASIPALGEADVLRTVQLLPGVLARNDFSAGYNVRGGESDQNLVLLDGIPVYNPFHLGGMFGTFIDDAIRSIELLAGGFPAEYGGRLSSVLDVASAEEARQGVHGSVGVSLLATTVALGGALPSMEGTWNVAARRTYADAVAPVILHEYLPYHFRDAQFHASHLIPGGGTLSLTAYDGLDVLDGSFAQIRLDEDDSTNLGGGDFLFDWGNRLAGLAWQQPLRTGVIAGDSGLITQRLSYSRFATGLDLGNGSLELDNRVSDARLSGSLTSYRGAHGIRVGYDYTRHHVEYSVRSSQVTATLFTLEQKPSAIGAFAEDVWRPTERLIVRPGVRVEHVTGADWTGISPRISAKFFVNRDFAITAAAGQYAQWLHALQREDLPIRIFDFWLGADPYVPVSLARHGVLGVESWVSRNRFVRVEGFLKRYSRLVEANPADDPAVRGDEFLPLAGTSYGVDVLLRQLESGAVSGWLAYSYGVSKRSGSGGSLFPSRVHGFFPAQDRRHNLNAVVSYRTRSRYIFGARFGFGTGTPFTPIVGQLVRRVYDPARNAWDIGVLTRNRQAVGGQRNSARFPHYQRLDLSVSRRIPKGNAVLTPFLQVINAYNRRNVFTYLFDYSANPPTQEAISQFPILPTIGLTVEF
jgi:hypothetical protein